MLTQSHPLLSSSGLTGRSSNPRALDSITRACVYWIPAFAGMTSSAGMTASAGRTRAKITNKRNDRDLT
jgi:hypothetical protein